MPIAPERARLADQMERRRRDLGLRWQDVAEAGKLSLKTIHSVRTTDQSFNAQTEAGVEDGLRWQRGSVRRILAGDDPVPRMSAPPPGFPPATPEQLAYMVPYLAEIEDAVELARFRHPGEDLTGALVFPRSARDQDLWDFFRKQDWPLAGMIWMLANSRAWDEQQAELDRKGRATGLARVSRRSPAASP